MMICCERNIIPSLKKYHWKSTVAAVRVWDPSNGSFEIEQPERVWTAKRTDNLSAYLSFHVDFFLSFLFFRHLIPPYVVLLLWCKPGANGCSNSKSRGQNDKVQKVRAKSQLHCRVGPDTKFYFISLISISGVKVPKTCWLQQTHGNRDVSPFFMIIKTSPLIFLLNSRLVTTIFLDKGPPGQTRWFAYGRMSCS